MSYYDRAIVRASDGTPSFSTPADTANEDAIRARLEAAWQCELQRFGHLSPIDYFAQRHGRVTALVEIKTRTHAIDRYPTVFLNVRKWLALMLGSVGHGVPAVFVAGFTDGVRWISVARIDAGRMAIGGTSRIVKAASDIEPVIHVPVADMREVA